MTKRKTGFWKKIGHGTDRLRGRPVEHNLKPYYRLLHEIDARAKELDLTKADDQALREHAAKLKQRAQTGESPDDLLADTFALVREASARALGQRHFDVQMLAGMALHRGRLVEMQTGEGKTLAATLPACLNALGGQGVHVLTFNHYLAARDAEWMGPVYTFLGLTVAAITEDTDRDARREAYRADVTYLTAKEAGYDFLRESIVRDPADRVLRPYHFAIVDEADSILIDEARIPLVIAGTDDTRTGENRARLAGLVRSLDPDSDFETDANLRNVYLTEPGIAKAERLLGCQDLHGGQDPGLLTRLNQALHARVLLERDIDYIVRDGKVEIVDEFTGRVVTDRHWPDGLHRAVEAKEGLSLHDQGRILNSISTQHFMMLYPKLAGMTGTALPAEREFFEFYKLKSVVIPPNRPCIREDREDLLFADRKSKHLALLQEVLDARSRGQPVLIGTSSVSESEQLAKSLREAQVECQVLNAINDASEARIIKQAGAPGAITVSTNMAGRGTDIRLGGADESRRDEVAKAGGLYVIGTNRHESRRIDNQLRGRAGRQGDPGVSRFFISLDDPLLKKYGIDELLTPRQSSQIEPGRALKSPGLHRKVSIVQDIIEGQNLDIRQTLFRYTIYLEQKRRQLHALRDESLFGNPRKLSRLSPEKFQSLAGQVGQSVLDQVERQISLHHLDQAWCDYLAHIADVRESIYLNVVGSRDPLQEFLKAAAESYHGLESRLDDGILETFERVAVGPNGIDLDKEGLRGPSSTWTYIINDNPFEWQLNLASPRNIGAGAWAAVLAAMFWFIPVGYKIGKLLKPRKKADKH